MWKHGYGRGPTAIAPTSWRTRHLDELCSSKAARRRWRAATGPVSDTLDSNLIPRPYRKRQRNARGRPVSGVDSVTVLTTKGPLATKRIALPPGATKPVIEAYGRAAHFGIWEAPVSGVDDLAALLSTVELRPTSFLVRGKTAAGVDRRNAKRRLHARKAKDGTVEPATIEGAARHWIPLDFDSIACPDWLDPVHEPDRAVEHVVGLLPEEFHGATCWWAFTSGQSVKGGIRIRLFFWADRALADWELKAWLGERVPIAGRSRSAWPRRFPVDLSIFAPAQPIYVARPVFVGMPDPVPTRSGIWRGDRDAITPPEIEKPKRHVAAPGRPFSGEAGKGYEYYRSSIGDREDGNGFYAPVKSAVAAWIARQGAVADITWLRADLEHAIRSATRDPAKHDDGYIEFRVADLDHLIEAIVELQATKEAKPAHCKPTYPRPFGSVAEARAALSTVFDQFVAETFTYYGEPMRMAA
jgi:hypothetical protein